MKRLHIHVGVSDLDQSIGFYSTLFGSQPTVVKADYAKWMLDDPRVNFAVSSGRHARKGIEHLGIEAEMAGAGRGLWPARLGGRPCSGSATTCATQIEKSWVTDPDA